MTTPFTFSSEVYEAFTYGDCYRLAKEIHDLTNYPIFAVGCQFDTRSEKKRDWCHMVVQIPDGRYADVAGIWDEDDLLNWWGDEYTDCHELPWEDLTCACVYPVKSYEKITIAQDPSYPEIDAAPVAAEIAATLARLAPSLVTC